MILYNNKQVEFGKFPNGEINLKKIHIDAQDLNHVVTLKYEDDSDLFKLLLVRVALATIPVTLRITYVPYSRMDRDNETYVFSLKIFAQFINAMNWDRVVIYEPHSDVTPALLDRVQEVNVTASPTMRAAIRKALVTNDYQVLFPDAGAQKRYADEFRTSALLTNGDRHLVGFKNRDFTTGRITDMSIIGERVNNNVAIVDDLCSRGGTFVMAAKALREMGFQRIVLAVAHCENTIYLGEVFNHIDKVITTDSIMSRTTQGAIEYMHKNKLQVIPLTEFKWH